jgi:hypothetical protein
MSNPKTLQDLVEAIRKEIIKTNTEVKELVVEIEAFSATTKNKHV